MRDTRTRLLAFIENAQSINGSVLTVSALAKAVGISRSSIYKYYPDVLARLAVGKSNTSLERALANSNKVDLMRKQLVHNRDLVSYLTNICSNQLVEISRLKEDIDQLNNSTTAKISYLESKLAKLEKPLLRTVK